MTQTPLYTPSSPVDWQHADDLVPYEQAVAFMESHAKLIADGAARERVWLLEHPPLYTAGTSAQEADLVDAQRFDVFQSGRGGQYTYHGPGQRVAYVMLDLRERGRDVSAFVRGLERWIITTLSDFDIKAEQRKGRVGVWVTQDNGQESKVAAIGVRLRKWVSFHGISINLNPELEHFSGIVPCGISEHGVTSLAALGKDVTMEELDAALRARFEEVFGPTHPA